MDWQVKGVNYWDNLNCPRDYLENALIKLMEEVEGVKLPQNSFQDKSDLILRREIRFYEYVASK